MSSSLLAQSVQGKVQQNDKKVAIFTQDGAEILDLAAPLEILSVSGFDVYTVGLEKKPIRAQHLLTFIPDYDIETAPVPDILMFVGGGNTQERSKEEKIKHWVKSISEQTDINMSICSGAFFLAEAGLLEGKEATTFHMRLDYLSNNFKDITVNRTARVVQDGNVISTAGVSAGIDGSLHLVEQVLGADVAEEVRAYIEYNCWDKSSIKIVKH